jgi:hypothetical protein
MGECAWCNRRLDLHDESMFCEQCWDKQAKVIRTIRDLCSEGFATQNFYTCVVNIWAMIGHPK